MFSPRIFSAMLLAVVLALTFGVGSASAQVTFTATGTNGSNGPVDATLTFSAGNGVLIVTVTNTLPNASAGVDIGQAVSSFNFTVNTIPVPTAFTGLSGVVGSVGDTGGPPGDPYTLASGTAFSDTVSGNIDQHWAGFGASMKPATSPEVGLGTAGNFAADAQTHRLDPPWGREPHTTVRLVTIPAYSAPPFLPWQIRGSPRVRF